MSGTMNNFGIIPKGEFADFLCKYESLSFPGEVGIVWEVYYDIGSIWDMCGEKPGNFIVEHTLPAKKADICSYFREKAEKNEKSDSDSAKEGTLDKMAETLLAQEAQITVESEPEEDPEEELQAEVSPPTPERVKVESGSEGESLDENPFQSDYTYPELTYSQKNDQLRRISQKCDMFKVIHIQIDETDSTTTAVLKKMKRASEKLDLEESEGELTYIFPIINRGHNPVTFEQTAYGICPGGDVQAFFQNKIVDEGVWMSRNVSENIIEKINTAVDQLATATPLDIHPGTNGVVRDIIHPSLFPLLLKTSQTNSLPKPKRQKIDKQNKWSFFGVHHEVSKFQWLPAEVEVTNGAVFFSSEINGLDRAQYPALYEVLGSLLSALVPGMEQVWQYARTVAPFKRIDSRDLEEGKEYDLAPEVSFKNASLQVIVKVVDYNFEPGASFNGVWHYEGMPHEDIVMTGLFYSRCDEGLQGPDGTNSYGGLEFKRLFTNVEWSNLFYNIPHDRPNWVEELIRKGFVPLGFCETSPGIAIVFPNCHAHKVKAMVNNTDHTVSRRVIAFFVINPYRRIVSTREFPPAILREATSLEQAFQHRLELMEERKYEKSKLNPREIELCEH